MLSRVNGPDLGVMELTFSLEHQMGLHKSGAKQLWGPNCKEPLTQKVHRWEKACKEAV